AGGEGAQPRGQLLRRDPPAAAWALRLLRRIPPRSAGRLHRVTVRSEYGTGSADRLARERRGAAGGRPALRLAEASAELERAPASAVAGRAGRRRPGRAADGAAGAGRQLDERPRGRVVPGLDERPGQPAGAADGAVDAAQRPLAAPGPGDACRPGDEPRPAEWPGGARRPRRGPRGPRDRAGPPRFTPRQQPAR